MSKIVGSCLALHVELCTTKKKYVQKKRICYHTVLSLNGLIEIIFIFCQNPNRTYTKDKDKWKQCTYKDNHFQIRIMYSYLEVINTIYFALKVETVKVNVEIKLNFSNMLFTWVIVSIVVKIHDHAWINNH